MKRAGFELLVLAVLALGWTWVAWRVWPCWDDAWAWLASRRLSPSELRAAHGNRALHGWLEAELSAHGMERTLSAVAHFVSWLATGLISSALFRRVYPEARSLGIVAGVLAVSPVFATTQVVLNNATWSGSVPALCFWGPFVLLYFRATTPSARIASAAIGGVALLGGSLLSEYAVAAGLAGAAFVALFPDGSPARPGRRAWISPVVIGGVALLGYALLRATARGHLREDTTPDYLLHHLAQRLLGFPFLLVTGVWQGAFGALLSRIGGLRVLQDGLERVTVFGLLLGGAAAWGALRWFGGAVTEEREPADALETLPGPHRREIALLAGIAAGLLPFALTARVPADDATSRYFLPVLPLTAVLSVALVRKLAFSTRGRALAIALLTGTCFFWTVTTAGAAMRDRARVRVWARELAPRLAGGSSLLVLSSTAPWPAYTRDYELTARMRLDLRRTGVRDVWVTREVPGLGSGVVVLRGANGARTLALDWFRVRITAEPLARVVWASVGPGGRLRVSPLEN